MDLSEKELEEKLFEGGNKLLSPSSSIPELLASLDLVEHLLGGVEQSPSVSMKEALVPSTKALIAEELLRHSNPDVKVAVASCISEITRITAPEAPYEDDQMKELFQLIVSSFEKLDDKSSSSYRRRTSILETVAKVRSCVVMLDLECDELIVEMFRHFFKTIRDDHEDGVVSSMETIMTLVVEESEDISVDLLSPILNVLKKDNKDVLPIACQLGEKVIVDCAAKLKPYLLPAVRSNGASLDDYSKVVADACQAGDEAVEPTDDDATNKNVADENNMVNTPSETAVEVAMETLEDAPPSEEVANTVESLKTVMSNGILEKGNDNTSVANDNSKEDVLDIQDDKAEPNETIADSVSSEEPSKAQLEKSNNTSESIDNSKEADLDTQDEKAVPSETIADGIGSEEPPKYETKSEKSNNTSEVNDNSMEVDLDTQDDKAEPSETIADSVGSEEPPRSQIKPDNSKEPELDTQIEKAKPSETIADSEGSEELPKSKPQKSNSNSAPDDNSKEADLDKQDEKAESSEMIVDKQDEKAEPSEMIVDKQDEKAEPSEMIVDSVGSEEPSKSNTKPEKSNSNCAANDNSKEADLDTQDEKAEPSEMIVDSVGSEEPPKSKTKPGKSKKRRGKRSKSKKKSTKPLKPLVSDRIMEVVDSSEHQDNTKYAADNAIQSKDPVVHTTEAADDEKSSKALISSPKTSDNERVDISSPSPSESLADETRSEKAGVGKKKEGTIKDGETVSSVDTKKESDSESEKESTGSERKLNKGGNKKPSSDSDNEESVPDATDDMKEDDSIDELHGSSAQDLAQQSKVGGSQRTKTKKQGQAKPTPAKGSNKKPSSESDNEESVPDATDGMKEDDSIDEVDGSSAQDLAQKTKVGGNQRTKTKKKGQVKPTPAKGGNKKPSSVSDNEESVPDATDDMKEDDSIDEVGGSSAQNLAQKTKLGGSQRTKTKKQGQAKQTPAKSRKKTPAKDEREKTAGPLKSNTKATRDESDVEEALKSSSKRKRPSGKKAPKSKVYRGDLIGATVKVWWPEDKAFYKGAVSDFDPAEKKHTVSYDDGEIEVLDLKEEEWQLISLSEEHANASDSPDESDDETPIGKKVKTDLEAKRVKNVSSSKKSGASSSKSKATPKSGSKQAINKVSGKSKEEDKAGKSTKALKLGNRPVDDDAKSARKSKVDDTNTPKVSSKSKQDMSKGASKSKGKTPKSVGKSSSVASGKVKAVTQTNSEESEDASSEPERAPVKSKGNQTPKSQNSSKKRKRSGKN